MSHNTSLSIRLMAVVYRTNPLQNHILYRDVFMRNAVDSASNLPLVRNATGFKWRMATFRRSSWPTATTLKCLCSSTRCSSFSDSAFDNRETYLLFALEHILHSCWT